jgi:DNA-directed RNA polymerase specialized sigma24 family protein
MAQTTYRRTEEIPAERGLPTLGEYAEADDCPLLRLEWAIICRKAHLTYLQQQAFSWYHIDGLSLRDTAAIMGCEIRTVRAHLDAAYSRLKRVPNQGLLTILVEIFGLTDVMEALQE